MAFSSSIPGFMEVLNQPSTLTRRKAERAEQYEKTLAAQKKLFDIEKMEREKKEKQRQRELTDRKAFVNRAKEAVDLYQRRGKAAQGVVQNVLRDAVKNEYTDLIPVLGGALKGDEAAVAQLGMEDRAIRRQLGEEVEAPDDGNFMVMKDGTIAPASLDDPMVDYNASPEQIEAMESMGGYRKVNKMGGVHIPEFTETLKKIHGTEEKQKTEPISDEEKLALGFPEDSVVQKKPDGTYNVVYKPSETGVSLEFDGETVRYNVGGRQVSPDTGALTGSEQRGARKTIRDAQAALSQGSEMLGKIQEAPGATGIRGTIVENVGGLIGQIPVIGRNLENKVSKVVAGGTPQEVQEIRSELITQVAQQLSRITGEESGRYTEAERQLAMRALKALGPEASIDQVMGAQKSAMRAQLMAMTRARENIGASPLFDPQDDESINTFGGELENLGFEDDEVMEILERLMSEKENRLVGGS